MTDETIPILVDTDIGSNVDDALCLAYLLKHPRSDLLGITTVTGEPQKRAQLASALCHAAGQPDIPVFSGADKPLLGETRQPHIRETPVLKNWPHQSDIKPNGAIDFLRKTIRERPGEITLLAIGPLTNIALLFAIDPAIPDLLKQLVIMGGVYFWQRSREPVEWNTINDVYASARVFDTAIDNVTVVGLDIGRECWLEGGECRRRLYRHRDDDLMRLVIELGKANFLKREVYFCDPLAGAVIFEPDLCQYQFGSVTVNYDYEPGTTHFHPQRPPHTVASSVNCDRFFDHFFSILHEEG